MNRARRTLIAALAVAAVAAPARAAEPAAPLVLVVDEPGLPAAALRDAVARELGVAVVAPDEPPAARARGTLVVSVDGAAGGRRLYLVYRDAAGRETGRMMSVGDDPAALVSTVALLAGNLA